VAVGATAPQRHDLRDKRGRPRSSPRRARQPRWWPGSTGSSTGSRTVAARIDDPALAGVATPQGRIRIEGLQTEIDALRLTLGNDLAPALGVAAGFNALDGD
jgi:hypothetical protein